MQVIQKLAAHSTTHDCIIFDTITFCLFPFVISSVIIYHLVSFLNCFFRMSEKFDSILIMFNSTKFDLSYMTKLWILMQLLSFFTQQFGVITQWSMHETSESIHRISKAIRTMCHEIWSTSNNVRELCAAIHINCSDISWSHSHLRSKYTSTKMCGSIYKSQHIEHRLESVPKFTKFVERSRVHK